jgi:hypothetical protein
MNAIKIQVRNQCSIWYGLRLQTVDHSERSNVLIAAQEKNPARNAMDVHVQDFVANEDLLLPILKCLMFLV